MQGMLLGADKLKNKKIEQKRIKLRGRRKKLWVLIRQSKTPKGVGRQP
jgi:hypothetical protein